LNGNITGGIFSYKICKEVMGGEYVRRRYAITFEGIIGGESEDPQKITGGSCI
jgi:hypothetical protein